MKPPYRFDVLPKHPPRNDMAGDWAGLDKGTGYEFWGLRKYLPGDSWSRIDWKACARSGELHVREFLKDSAYNLMLLCDISRSMHFGNKFGLAKDLTVSLAHAALRSNNPCGLLLFADKVLTWIPPSAAPRQFHHIVSALQQAPSTKNRKTQLAPPLKLVMKRLSSCFGVIISDFHTDLSSLKSLMDAADQRFPAHEMVALHVLEDSEYHLTGVKDGLLTLQDMESGQQMALDLSGLQEFNTLLRLKRERTARALAGVGVDSAVLPTSATDIQARVNTLLARRLAARV
ncbi:hypothetical protein A7E78_06260 [Syntrophotalea acetylenivorans]|uniref:DUF58 domain-containing protein n=1 Tax=Syntrophotalea acetylenivorans TaxID=1842532 RepID=A0A1L3GP75_9BACT|nr:DUF58 domain-containing protein [Syntrophotalea acetylenivorans]APG27478.1 hypothetical protein A7E78_06260 [Syntrophotalea acetylenivorans]